MAEREKVIRGMELCAYDPDPGQTRKDVHSCSRCPYYDHGCEGQLYRDALALLKEQEPRVMTRKEIENSGGTEFYSEHKDEEYMYLDHTEGPAYIMGNMERLPLNRLRWGDYGRTWRCWTSRPTPEQMRETKWEGAENADMR